MTDETTSTSITSDFDDAALFYHRHPKPGKLSIQATKALGNQRDLALAYSPGVAAPCLAIQADPASAADYTARANLVAVISNGTAVLGLGNIGALASKPVMEGKAVLFKKFADIDVFDIEVNAENAEKMIETVAALEPTFGGINLEDIKAPECFEIEDALRRRMSIPVFHDDQHGTAIIVGAAVLNGLELAGKVIEEVKIVTSGAGAAALACLNLLVSLGARRENIWVCDIEGVVYQGRNTLMDKWKEVYAQETDARRLSEVIGGADVFLGLSAPGVLKPEMLAQMADTPLVLALANPRPEIMPAEARAARVGCGEVRTASKSRFSENDAPPTSAHPIATSSCGWAKAARPCPLVFTDTRHSPAAIQLIFRVGMLRFAALKSARNNMRRKMMKNPGMDIFQHIPMSSLLGSLRLSIDAVRTSPHPTQLY